MNFKPVNSSRMNGIAWEDDTMYIQFRDGSIYAYANVTRQQYLDFLSSPSLGHALVEFQKIHKYRRV